MAWQPILTKGSSWQPTLEVKPPVSREPAPYVDNPFVGQFNVSGTTPRTSTADTGKLLLEIGQATFRGYGALGADVLRRVTGEGSSTITPGNVLERTLYGNQPFNPQTVGEEYPFIPKGSEYAPVLAFGGVLGDLIPGAGASIKVAARSLRAAQTAAEAAKAMRALKLSEEAIKEFSLFFAKEKDLGKITSTLESIVKAERVAPKVTTPTPIGTRLPDETKAKTLGFLRSIQEDLPGLRVGGGEYLPRPTSPLATKAANFVRDDILSAETFARTGGGDAATAVGAELLKHYERIASTMKDLAAREAVFEKAADIANTLATRLNAEGRSIQAAAIISRLTPEGQIRFISKEIEKYNIKNPKKQIPKLSGQEAEAISTEMRAIQEMPDGEARAMRFKQLQDKLKARIPSSLLDQIVAVWKAGLLTGLKTTGLNVLSTLANASLELAKDLPATAADFLASLLTGKRTTTLTGSGVVSGTKEGIERGWRYFKTGYDSRDVVAKLDYKPVTFKSKEVQTYVDTVFRSLGAQDQVAYYGALKHSLYSQAAAEAKNLGLKGKEAVKHIEERALKPTPDMSAAAAADAEMAVFQNETVLSSVGRSIQKIPGASFVLPFVRTPSAVAMQIVNYSPVGFVGEVGKQIATGKFDQRKLVQAIGRSTTGVPILWLGTQLFNSDSVSLEYPKTERERELWKLEGRKENSIKIDGAWRSAATLGPAGPILLMGAYFQRALKETGSPTDAMVEATFGTLGSFTEQTFLSGLKTVLDAVTDPEQNAKYVASNFISSFIPTIIGDVARATDPKERRAETVWERVLAKLPAARQTLEPQVNVLGEERERVGNPLEVILDPTRPSKAIKGPVVDELRRLYDAGYKVSPTLLGDRAGYKSLTPQQNTDLWKRSGEITNQKLTNLVSKPEYQSMSDEEKSKVVSSFIEKSTIAARAELVLELTRGLEGEELKAKLAELKQAQGGSNKILTKEVFSLWQEIR